MDQVPASGNVTVDGDLHATNVITGIQYNVTVMFPQPFTPPPDLKQLRHDYLAYLRDSYRYLDMQGIRQVQQVTQQLALTAVYVPLKARSGRAAAGRVAGRLWSQMPAESATLMAEEALARPMEPVPIEVALHTDPAIVVLGDPGSGKSTLLKVLALALADQADGPLPILLPLNAYARRLQQGDITLSQLCGEYYARRQDKLAQVGALFQHALAQHQAIVLLDGLDEVQAHRAHLVRLVQDFVAEHIPLPYEPPPAQEHGDRSPGIVSGNRVVVTSRIVGYDTAPLRGPHWRTYTLSDFTRADIEQFVTQWTLALYRSIQGDTDPARRAAARERDDLLAAISTRPSVERLAANPLLLTILALIKHTGVVLPEQRVKLYELYLQTLIESWNLGRSLDQYPVGEPLNYEETVQVLAPLALWLRQENPTAGLVTQQALEDWLTAYYHGEEWGLSRGQARQRGRVFLDSVERYSNLLLERGERQYGFLHLTLEEMLAAQGMVQRLDEHTAEVQALFQRYIFDPVWHETLQLAIGFIGVIQRRPAVAGNVLQELLGLDAKAPKAQKGRAVIFAGEALLDMGAANISRKVALATEQALVQTMQATACPIRTRRDAGHLLGRLGWVPEPHEGDLLLAPADGDPTGLDAFQPVPGTAVWMGKYPVTNRQFARFMAADGYNCRAYWSDAGWDWRQGVSDSKAPDRVQIWLKERPKEKRYQPYWWDDRKWNSPLFPVVGISWFEAEAYTRWLTKQLYHAGGSQAAHEVVQGLQSGRFIVRLPTETEWEAAIGGRGEYPWGTRFHLTRLNCADSWEGRRFANDDAWYKWLRGDTESFHEASTTAVTTYPQGVSQAGMWDGSGNVWEWMNNPYTSGEPDMVLRGGAWGSNARDARVSSRNVAPPANFRNDAGLRVVVAPVL